VFLNGVKLAAADYTASNGSDVVLATGATTGDILEVVAYTTFEISGVAGLTPSIDDNGNATAITIDSSEHVLVGKTTGSYSINVVGAEITPLGEGQFTVSSNPVLQLNRKTSDGDIALFRKDGTTVGSIASRAGTSINVNSQSGDLYLQRGGTTGLIVNPTYLTPGADATATLGGSWARFTDLYLSGGVFLGGTGAANKLSDVETGTWTPTANFDGTSNATYSRQAGSYTKIGRFVFCEISIIFNKGTSSGALLIGGFPFAQAVDVTNDRGTGTFGYTSGVTGIPIFLMNGSATSGYVRNASTGGNAHIGSGDLAASTNLHLSVTYKTS